MTVAVSEIGARPDRTWPARPVQAAALLAMAGALLAGFLVTDHARAASVAWRDGPNLVRLLRGMALLKMLMAAGASAGVIWRLDTRTTPAWLAGYAAAGLAMWAGPGLIWHLAHLRLGALLLHGGLFGAVAMLWRDPVAGARLAAIIAARRRILQAR